MTLYAYAAQTTVFTAFTLLGFSFDPPLQNYSSSSSVICQMTGPKPLPKRFLHIVRSRASSFNWQYPLLSLRSSSSFSCLLPRLLVTSICPFIFPSITCCRRQFLRKMWPIQLAFHFLISCRIFLCSLTPSNTSSFLTWSVQLIFSILLQHHISKLFTSYETISSWMTLLRHAVTLGVCRFSPATLHVTLILGSNASHHEQLGSAPPVP